MTCAQRVVLSTCAAVLISLVGSAPASAHNEPISTSRFRVSAADGAVGCTITFTGPDVVTVARLGDVSLPAEGTKAREAQVHERILAEVARVVRVESDGAPCVVTPLQVFGRKGYEVSLRWQCPARLGALSVTMAFIEFLPNDHKHLLEFDAGVRQGAMPPPAIKATLDRAQPTFTHVFAGGGGSVLRAQASELVASLVPRQELSMFDAVRLGLHHIASGPDHILFIIGILLVARRARPVVLLATTFTLAHSTTLALAALGVTTVSSAVVEPLIAASLIVIAVEALPWRAQANAPGTWRRVALVFAFGLLHGLGFAGGLLELNLEGRSLVTALFGFNVGVELGQLAIAAVGLPLLALVDTKRWYPRNVAVPAALGIGFCGLYWTVTRLFGE